MGFWKVPAWAFRKKGGRAMGRSGHVARCLFVGWFPRKDVARKEYLGTDKDKHSNVEVPAGTANDLDSGRCEEPWAALFCHRSLSATPEHHQLS